MGLCPPVKRGEYGRTKCHSTLQRGVHLDELLCLLHSSCVVCDLMWNHGESSARLFFFFSTLAHRVLQNFTQRSITAVIWWKLPFVSPVSTASVVGLRCVVCMASFVSSSFHSSEERQWPVTVGFMWGQLGRIWCAGWLGKNCCVGGINWFSGLVVEKKQKTNCVNQVV